MWTPPSKTLHHSAIYVAIIIILMQNEPPSHSQVSCCTSTMDLLLLLHLFFLCSSGGISGRFAVVQNSILYLQLCFQILLNFIPRTALPGGAPLLCWRPRLKRHYCHCISRSYSGRVWSVLLYSCHRLFTNVRSQISCIYEETELSIGGHISLFHLIVRDIIDMYQSIPNFSCFCF